MWLINDSHILRCLFQISAEIIVAALRAQIAIPFMLHYVKGAIFISVHFTTTNIASKHMESDITTLTIVVIPLRYVLRSVIGENGACTIASSVNCCRDAHGQHHHADDHKEENTFELLHVP